MPFTLAHPAATLPFRRLGLPLSALFVGAMAPDFSKFALLSPAKNIGHSWDGILWFCIPTGLLALALFHFILKEPLFTFLPLHHQTKVVPHVPLFSLKTTRELAVVCIAIAIGAATHLVWDSFTHDTGWSVQYLPILKRTAFMLGKREIRIYKILQHGSTLFGFTVLTLYYLRWLKNAPAQDVDSEYRTKWQMKMGLLLVFAILSACPALIFALKKTKSLSAFTSFLGRFVVAASVFFALQLVAYSALWHFRRNSSPRKTI